ncbi:MAG: hypothetical protein ACPGXZ_06685 [Saprospiraceae bacterium]
MNQSYKKLSVYLFAAIILLSVNGCNMSESASPNTKSGAVSTDIGTGGSLTRFTIVGDYLYVVGYNNLQQYDISSPPAMTFIRTISLSNGVETIFSKDSNLFIGTQTGMYIYEISTDGNLSYVSEYEHIVSCDPVVADDDYAYVTLRSGTECGVFSDINQLQIVSLENIQTPSLTASYSMDYPKGLGISDKTLFICDGTDLKVYNANNPTNLELVTELEDLHPNDIIPLGDRALVISPNDLYQIDYSDLDNISILSKISLD